MSDYDVISAVVIDNGSGTIRAGFSGDEEPTCVQSTVIGRPRSYTKCKGMDFKGYYIGDDAQKRRGVLSLDYPIELEIVTNWDDMEMIWHNIYESYLEEHPCLLTEPPLNPKYIWEKMAQDIVNNLPLRD